jgi:hypothetical protein
MLVLALVLVLELNKLGFSRSSDLCLPAAVLRQGFVAFEVETVIK